MAATICWSEDHRVGGGAGLGGGLRVVITDGPTAALGQVVARTSRNRLAILRAVQGAGSRRGQPGDNGRPRPSS